MVRIFIAALLTIFLSSSLTGADDRRSDQSRLTIMSFNAEFLWDGESPEEGQVNFAWKGDVDEARDRMASTAAIIRQANPDIVALVEVEGKSALDTLNREFLADDGYTAYLVKGRDSFTGQDVGLLTRIDPELNGFGRTDRKGKSGATEKSVSKNFYAKLNVGGHKIAVIGLHFLSRPGDASRVHSRQAQADAIRDQAVELRAEGYDIVVLGDFNDYDGTEQARDHVDSLPITDVLEIVRQLDAGDPNDDLENVLSRVPKAERYTAYWDQDRDGVVDRPHELTAIDHILLSPNLARTISDAQIIHGHDPRFVSDHFPVVVTLALGGTPTNPAQVVIARLLANPAGSDRANESVTLRNNGGATINLTGWRLRDLANKEWDLDAIGELAPNTEVTFVRNGQPMSLNNGGDIVELIDANGAIRHRVSYGPVEEDDEIIPVTHQ